MDSVPEATVAGDAVAVPTSVVPPPVTETPPPCDKTAPPTAAAPPAMAGPVGLASVATGEASVSDRFEFAAPRSHSERIAGSDSDFLSVRDWLDRCCGGQLVNHQGRLLPPTPPPARQHMRRVLLLTLIYHSSPYAVLRLVLDELLSAPPSVVPSVFDTREVTALAHDDDELGSSVSRRRHSSRPTRSADVAIAKHSNLQRMLTSDDPLLSMTPMSGASLSHQLTTPSTSTASGSLAASSVASTMSMSASSVPSASASSRDAPLSPSISRLSPFTQHTPTSNNGAFALPPPASSQPPSTPTPVVPIGLPPAVAVLRPTAYSIWHARKLHLLLLLHDWVNAFPQDFCCLPQLSVPTLAPHKRPLEELLYSELGSFPPASWRETAADHVDLQQRTSPDSPFRKLRTQPTQLTAQSIAAFEDLGQSLLAVYDASRARYRGEADSQESTSSHWRVSLTATNTGSDDSASPPAFSRAASGPRVKASPWNAAHLASATVERNLDSSKIRRMMMAPEAESRAPLSPTMRASVSVPTTAISQFISEFLATPPCAFAHALTWLAIQRMDEIGSCSLDDHGTLEPGATIKKPVVSYHHAAPLPSAAYLRLFLSMPPQLARRQMRMSNTMSCFVATTILATPTLALRKQCIQHWIDIAALCAPLLTKTTATTPLQQSINFMHCFEIIYGINHQSVYRLPAVHQTSGWGSVKGSLLGSSSPIKLLPLLHKRNFASVATFDTYTRLTKLTSPSGNYKEYRKALADAQATAVGEGPSFHVPYLGILLKDLVGLEDAGKPLAGVLGPELPLRLDDDEGGATEVCSPTHSTGSALHRSVSSGVSGESSSLDEGFSMPSGSLPWEDSFLLTRHRRNATLGDSPGSPSSSLLRDDSRREHLLQMLTEDGQSTEEGQLVANEVTTPSSTKKSVSLLTAALPGRHQSIVPSAPVVQPPSPSSPAVLMLNYSKLVKIHSLVESTLSCRLQFPSVPLEDEEEFLLGAVEVGNGYRSRGMTMRYARMPLTDSNSFPAMVAAAQLHTQTSTGSAASPPGRDSLTADPVFAPTVSSPSPSSSVVLPFDRRVQHWLLSAMLTLTLKSETQLMERSYAIHPRKTQAVSSEL